LQRHSPGLRWMYFVSFFSLAWASKSFLSLLAL
jgi:hypothetical protein